MKVLQITAVYGKGSNGIIAKDINDTLIKSGYESYKAYKESNSASDNGYRIGNIVDYKLHGLFTRIFGKQAYFSVLSTKQLLNYIDVIKPDIIHLHNLHSNYINLNMLLRYIIKNNIKTVITLHDCWFFTGKCFHYTLEKCFKWQTKCSNCPRLKKDVPSWFFDKTTQVFNDKKQYFQQISDLYVIGVSDWISNEARKSIFKDKKIATIYNGIDTDIFKPTKSDFRKKLNIPNNKFIILGMANKWLQPINEKLFHYISRHLTDTNDILVLLGCTKQQKKHLPSNVIGLGYVNSKAEMAQIYSMADVFVNTTWEDSFPTVNIEAICCGTPVITYNSCGSTEAVSDNTGIIVPQGQQEKLWEAIKMIKQKGKHYYEDNCVKFGRKNFNKDINYLGYIDIYKELLSQKY